LFLFKPEWIIDKFKLTNNFSEERLPIKISKRSTIILSTILLGGYLGINTLSDFVSALIQHVNTIRFIQDNFEDNSFIYNNLHSGSVQISVSDD